MMSGATRIAFQNVSVRFPTPGGCEMPVVDNVTYDIRDRELARPAKQRVITPFSRWALAIARRFTPTGAHQNLHRKLLMAGNPAGWDTDRVLATKVGGLVVGLVIGAALLVGLPFNLGLLLLAFLAMCLLGYFLPNIVLLNVIQRRQAKMRLALPDAIDMPIRIPATR